MPKPPPAKGNKGAGKGLLKNKKALTILGGGVAVVGAYALVKHGSGTGADTSGATAATGATPTYDSTGSDQFNQLANQIAGLQDQIATITAGTPTTAPKPTPKPTPKPPKPPANHKPGPVRRKPAPLGSVTVSRGQTLSGIAKSHHETLGQVLKDNPVYTTNKKYKGGSRIFAGDKVKVR